jgi:hypothetical protein
MLYNYSFAGRFSTGRHTRQDHEDNGKKIQAAMMPDYELYEVDLTEGADCF